MSVAIMNPQQPTDAEQKSRLASVPAWGSYLYQNFLLPAFSPTTSMSEWLNLNTPFAALTPRGSQPQQTTQQPDYFGSGWKEDNKANTMPFAQNDFGGHSFAPSASMQQSASYPTASRSNEAGPSNYYPQFYSQPSISTSLLVNDPANYSAPLPPTLPFHRPSVDQPHSRNSINMVDVQLTHSPSPMNTHTHSPRMSPKRAAKRRCDSLDESEDHEHDHLSEHEPDVPEGVERDGMIWGMKVEAYRALSARERKRVRNRISARTFRAKRKEHLSSLEENMNIKDLKLRLATEEANRLKQEVADLKRRLAKYE